MARAPGVSELVARTDAGLLVVHDAGPLRVRSVVLHEPGAQQRIPPHSVVLAAGHQDGNGSLEQLVAEAAGAQAVAVVAKPSSVGLDALRLLGEQHCISTILAEQSVDWLWLASMLRSAAAVSSVDAVAGIRVGDLFALANAIALATGGATAIVDPAGRLLGFSNLSGQPLDEVRRRATLLMAEQDSPARDPDYRRLYASTSCIHIPAAPGMFDRIALAVRSDGEILGSVWVLLPPDRDQHHAERALLDLVESAAVHLHRARAELDVQRSRYSHLLHGLLRGTQSAAGSVAALGIADRSWFRLAVLVLDSSQVVGMSRSQARSVVNWLDIVHGNARVAEIDSLVVVLFSGQRLEEWRYVEGSLDSFLRNSDALRGAVAVATGVAVSDVQDLSSEFDRLNTLSRLIVHARVTAAGGSRIFRMEDHWPQVELATIAEAYATDHPRRLSALTRIRDHDLEHDTEYWPTLRTFVLCDRNFTVSAAQLNLHANTVRYRIERLKSTFGLDLTNPSTFVWVAVQIHHLAA